MRPKFRRCVAVLVCAAMLAVPVSALAEEGEEWCPTYDQVKSNSTGGEYVGGILFYETLGQAARHDSTVTTSTTTTTSSSLGIPGSSVSSQVTVTVTVNNEQTILTTYEPVGYYRMNDGSVWQINCISGKAKQLSSPS